MIKHPVSILLVLLCLTGCAQKFSYCDRPNQLMSINIVDQNDMTETISTAERLKEYEQVDFLSPQPYKKVLRVFCRDGQGNTGACVTTYHPNGQPQQYLETLNNRAHGWYKEWYADGQRKLEVYVVGGEADLNTAAEKTWLFDGRANAWSEKNDLQAVISYSKGELQGDSIYYHPNGCLWKKIPYKKGIIHGNFEVFLENGDLLQTTPYVNGIKHGVAKKFWNPNFIAAEETYENGLLVTGHYIDLNGKEVASIKNGTGTRPLFGKCHVCELQEYHNGVLEGEVKVFGSDQSLVRLHHVKDGLKHGEEIEYFPQNPFRKEQRPMLSITWYEGKIHGLAKTWYENGVQESQREICNNSKTGLSTAWYRDGSLMLIEEYDQNKLVKGEYFKKGEKHPTSQIFIGDGTATLYDPDGNFLHRIAYHNGAPDE